MVSKWMPEWLARNYFKLSQEFKEGASLVSPFSRPFAFSEALNILSAGLGYLKPGGGLVTSNMPQAPEKAAPMVQKTLWELELRGFLTKRRSETDYRSKVYQLVSFDDALKVLKLYFHFPKGSFAKFSLKQKLALAPEDWKYVVTGSTAAAYYHDYQFPGKVVELAVNSYDYGKWIAFLSDKNTVVFTEEPMETKRAKQYVQLVSMPSGLAERATLTKEGVKIEKIEQLLADLILRGTFASVTEAISIIAANKDKIDWSEAAKTTEEQRRRRELVCLLEIINSEAKKKLVGEKAVEALCSFAALPTWKDVFPVKQTEEYSELARKLSERGPLLSDTERGELEQRLKNLVHYKEIGEKLGLTVLLPRAVVRKTLEDLGVELNA